MKKIYQKIKKEFPDKNIEFDEKYNAFWIDWEDYEVVVTDDKVDLLYKELPYDHMHPENDEDIYKIITYFINNADNLVLKVNKHNKVANILIIIFLLLLLLGQLYLYINR